jgi:hypothetical protein
MMGPGPTEPQGREKPRFVPQVRSREELPVVALSRETISDFLEWAAAVPTGYRDLIREEIAKVADDDALLAALCEELLATEDVDAVRQFLLLATIGETRNPRAVPSLVELIWREPEEKADSAEPADSADVASVGLLVGLQARAVEMLAHIGGDEADEAVLDAVSRHPEKAVRIAAIDGYLFNRDDAPEARDRLRDAAKSADVKFIGLPRFRQGGDRPEFEARVREFYDANRSERPPTPPSNSPLPRGESWRPSFARREPRRPT